MKESYPVEVLEYTLSFFKTLTVNKRYHKLTHKFGIKVPKTVEFMFEAPKSLTYASMVSMKSVRIALTLAALNDLEVKTSYIQIAYMKGPCSEKVHTRLGLDFGEKEGNTVVLVRGYLVWHHLVQASGTIL